ncbi:uncharacterized protein PAN0_058d6503 [Moesziomyces antarcticus]|uniref:Uncharacterized protein n=2 Tax=Pseudozyma antarctica TaxID=84753 RepID=A0A081CNL6_PSEA2|nr:uncharacterized protein PAN0_058d6503 [Moesziomyces antarcticus]GAK68262.1 conserved hypothetical protein [Moesziomyces antarcticus]SPO47327.1 related to conserved hypothetical Ustilaginaceae-specific protein [Moesziomyces antarcticus]
MKFSTALVALSAVVGSAMLAEAAPYQVKAVSWAEVQHKHAHHWKFFTQPRGVDLQELQEAKPFYGHCNTPKAFISNRKTVLHTFHNNPDFEFIQVDDNTIYANCINCSPQIMSNYYLTKLGNYIDCHVFDGKKN